MVHSHGELDESNGTVCEGKKKKTAFITGVLIFFPPLCILHIHISLTIHR